MASKGMSNNGTTTTVASNTKNNTMGDGGLFLGFAGLRSDLASIVLDACTVVLYLSAAVGGGTILEELVEDEAEDDDDGEGFIIGEPAEFRRIGV